MLGGNEMTAHGPDHTVLHRPVPAPERLAAPARATAPAHDPVAPMRLALVANGKPNSVELLDALARELRQRVRHLEVRRYRKGSVSVAPDDRDVREIGEWASAVLAALGD